MWKPKHHFLHLQATVRQAEGLASSEQQYKV